jgi:predicted phage tail protein
VHALYFSADPDLREQMQSAGRTTGCCIHTLSVKQELKDLASAGVANALVPVLMQGKLTDKQETLLAASSIAIGRLCTANNTQQQAVLQAGGLPRLLEMLLAGALIGHTG